LDTTYDVLIDLRERLAQADLVRIAELQHEIFCHKQGTTPFIDYFKKLKSLWEELENYCPIPHCPCRVKCLCHALKEVRMFRERDYTIRFLQQLNDDYNAIRSQILVKDILPLLNCVFSLILQYERQNGLSPEEDSQVFAYMSNFKRNFTKVKDNYSAAKKSYRERFYVLCQKPGHTEEVCYKKYCYPPGTQQKSGSVANTMTMQQDEEDDCSRIPSSITSPTLHSNIYLLYHYHNHYHQ
jgi:hypothetical protein